MTDMAKAWSAVTAEKNAEIARLRAQRTEFDCRYTLGDVADFSGQHCPPERPCMRCQRDQLLAALKEIIKRYETAEEPVEDICEIALATIAAVEHGP
jgi:hypothetical protein